MESRFDWYQATVPIPVRELVDGLHNRLKGSAHVEHLPHGGSGYTATARILDEQLEPLAVVLHGGNSHPNVRSSSERAPALAEALRKGWPEHRVSRLDVCADFVGSGTFQALVKHAQDTAAEHRLQTGLMFAPDVAERGHTYRLGAASSPVLLRIYEKGLEQQGRGVEADPDWVRMELQVRPQRKAKDTFARVAPSACWGASRWSQDLAERVSGHAPPRLEVNPLSKSSWEETQAHLVAQYRRHMMNGGRMELGAIGAHDQEHDLEAIARAYAERLVADLLRPLAS